MKTRLETEAAIVFDALPGTHIIEAATEAIERKKYHKGTAFLLFNSQYLLIEDGDHPSALADKYKNGGDA